jgi:putative protease
MRRKTDLPELLAPAGSFEALLAAVEAGADAVYLGGKSFGARAFAENFNIEELARAVQYAHLHNVKLYVTVNVLVYDRELDELSKYLQDLYEIGIDAIIAADLGVVREIRRITPNMPIHASTQMSVHNTLGAAAAHSLGCERVVVARELSLENMREIIENSPVEVECFLHGALCVSHSGQCLFSSLVGGRSGNRGECAQPCRLPYNNGKYPLSLCDLSLANHVKELIESGVKSLKIEGRMKSPDYVYNVTKIYRRLLDEGRDISKDENELLLKTFSRGGFTDKYFIGRKQEKMTGVRSEDDKSNTKTLGKRTFEMKKLPLSAHLKILSGVPAKLCLKLKNSDKCATAFGAVPVLADTSPLSRLSLSERLMKMGQTPFTLDADDIEIQLDEGLNLPPSAINALRRDAVSGLLSSKRELLPFKQRAPKLKLKTEKMRTALFLDPEAYFQYKNRDAFFDICFLPIEYFCDGFENQDFLGIYLPPVIFNEEIPCVLQILKEARKRGVKYALCTNLSNVYILKELGFKIIADFRLNISNSESARAVLDLGIERFILSPEITIPMARDIGGGVIVYGRIPLMLTERCFIKESFGCNKCRSASFKDRRGASFPIIREYGHRNIIVNSVITYMADKLDELYESSLNFHHYIFTRETGEDIKAVVSDYKNKRKPKSFSEIRRIGIK